MDSKIFRRRSLLLTRKLRRFMQIFLLLGFAGIVPAFSEEPGAVNRQGFYLGIDSSAFLCLNLGYAWNYPGVNPGGASWGGYGMLRLPLLLAAAEGSADSFEIAAGITADFPVKDSFHLSYGLELGVMRHDDTLGLAVPVLVSLDLMPVLRYETWYCGIATRITAAAATYIRHSDTVKEAFLDLSGGDGKPIEASPVDGWYGLTGLSIDGGIAYGRELGDHLEFSVNTGIALKPSPCAGLFDAMMTGQIPFYLETGCFYSP